ncbi:MAG: PLP-dependent transferase, partial [Alphaproteobacteria bacterium]
NNAPIEKFIDNLKLFKIGFSWGGYESLILPIKNLKPTKKITTNNKYWFRIHVGLEDVNDLKQDLENAIGIYDKQ